MTTETGGELRDHSEIKVERIRVIRSICRGGSGTTYSQTHVFLERLPINQTPTEITAKYLSERIGAPYPHQVISFSENPELNAVASTMFSHIRGRFDDTRALEEIRRLIILSRTLESTSYPRE